MENPAKNCKKTWGVVPEKPAQNCKENRGQVVTENPAKSDKNPWAGNHGKSQKPHKTCEQVVTENAPVHSRGGKTESANQEKTCHSSVWSDLPRSTDQEITTKNHQNMGPFMANDGCGMASDGSSPRVGPTAPGSPPQGKGPEWPRVAQGRAPGALGPPVPRFPGPWLYPLSFPGLPGNPSN